MIDRLDTINTELADQLRAMSFPETQKMTFSILEKALKNLPLDVVELLPYSNELLKQTVSQEQVDEVDNRYFTFEEQGDDENANTAFVAARLLSAIKIYQTATTSAELCEAIYEVNFSLEY